MVAGRRAKQVDPKRFGRFKTDGGFKLLPSLRFELHRTERGPAAMIRDDMGRAFARRAPADEIQLYDLLRSS